MPHLSLAEVDLYYEQRGEGPDLVWLAGGDQPGSDWNLFQIPDFADSFRNTTYDGRGVGQTRCRKPPPWPMNEYGQDCSALIEAVCEGPRRSRGPFDGLAHRATGLSRPSGARPLR